MTCFKRTIRRSGRWVHSWMSVLIVAMRQDEYRAYVHSTESAWCIWTNIRRHRIPSDGILYFCMTIPMPLGIPSCYKCSLWKSTWTFGAASNSGLENGLYRSGDKLALLITFIQSTLSHQHTQGCHSPDMYGDGVRGIEFPCSASLPMLRRLCRSLLYF